MGVSGQGVSEHPNFNIDQFKRNIDITGNDMKIFHTNIRSMYRNLENYLLRFQDINVDAEVIALSECWLTDNAPLKCSKLFSNCKLLQR